MYIDEFFDLLFPGDMALNVPPFRICDNKRNVDGFLRTVSRDFIEALSDMENLGETPEELIKELKSRDVDLGLVLNDALAFYFSRPAVVISLTGRLVPLSTSGMAKY